MDLLLFIATKPGEGFNAELIRIDIDAEVSSQLPIATDLEMSNIVAVSREYNLIGKFLVPDPFKERIMTVVQSHTREYLMYSKVVAELNRFQETRANSKFPLDIPELFFGHCNRTETSLVMQNIKVLGFETNPKQKGLNLPQCHAAIEGLARLHALSYAYDKEYGLLRNYPCFKFCPEITAMFRPIAIVGLKNLLQFLKKKKGYEHLAEKLERGLTTLPALYQQLWTDQTKHKMLCLTHGDYWNCNLMFSYSDEHKENLSSMKMIDWQLTQWSNPVMDLHYFFNSSTTLAIRGPHVEELLHKYHQTFTLITTTLGHPVSNYDYEEFRAEYQRTSLLGFLMGLILIQGTLSIAMEKLNKPPKTSQNRPSNNPFRVASQKISRSLAKALVKRMFDPSYAFIIDSFVKKMMAPVGKELMSESNTVMNSRLMELVDDCIAKGCFDEWIP